MNLALKRSFLFLSFIRIIIAVLLSACYCFFVFLYIDQGYWAVLSKEETVIINLEKKSLSQKSFLTWLFNFDTHLCYRHITFGGTCRLWGILQDSFWKEGHEVLPRNLRGGNGIVAKEEWTTHCSIYPFHSLALKMIEFARSDWNSRIHPRDRVT